MNYSKMKASLYAGLAIMLGLICSGTAYPSGAGTFYDINESLPVRSEGHRYTSNPYGEMFEILAVVQYVKSYGSTERVFTRGMQLPNSYRVVHRYDYTFPASCGGASYSYYEGEDFAALGYNYDGKVVLDVLEGGSPYSAPRLWGAYDQVLNDVTPMHMVVSFNGLTGLNGSAASFMAGKVTGMTSARQEHLGNAYSSGIYTSSRCNHPSGPGNLLVTK
jgi:hypothetical protein